MYTLISRNFCKKMVKKTKEYTLCCCIWIWWIFPWNHFQSRVSNSNYSKVQNAFKNTYRNVIVKNLKSIIWKTFCETYLHYCNIQFHGIFEQVFWQYAVFHYYVCKTFLYQYFREINFKERSHISISRIFKCNQLIRKLKF